MSLAPLLACAGRWHGVSILQDPHSQLAVESPSTLEVTPVLRGTFARVDYSWSYDGEPQEGTLLVGFQPDSGRCAAHWADTWHMGRSVMVCQGTASGDGILCVRGSYAAPPGPDWGWRIELEPGRDRLRLTMLNVSPEGVEQPAVTADYRRA